MEGNLGFWEGIKFCEKKDKNENFTLPKWKHWREISIKTTTHIGVK
jgi:hypothetical protein